MLPPILATAEPRKPPKHRDVMIPSGAWPGILSPSNLPGCPAVQQRVVVAASFGTFRLQRLKAPGIEKNRMAEGAECVGQVDVEFHREANHE